MRRSEKRLYLDHASTSWPKADGVVEAMASFLTQSGASPSRGNYAAARHAQQIVDRTRRRLTDYLSAESPACIAFQPGCTAALNAAIHGMLRPGDHAISSAVEHNAVLRPLREATLSDGSPNLSVVDGDADGMMDVRRMLEHVQPKTRMIALAHASNVTGLIQPVAELAHAVKQINQTRRKDQRIWVLCDAAQTLGYLPVNVDKLGVDILAAPAHKGCGGPTGIALLYLGTALHSIIRPTIQGGNGHDGLAESMASVMPEQMEAGTMNMPAIAGWDAAMGQMDRILIEKDAADETNLPTELTELSKRLHQQLNDIQGIRVVGRRGDLPIASIDFGPMLPATDAAAILDHEFSIDVRAGYHCAARIHQCLGTAEYGTVRISCGHSTKLADIDRVAKAVAEIANSIQ